MKKRKNLENFLLASFLIAVSGLGLAYNIYTAEDEGLSVSVSHFTDEWLSPEKGEFLNVYTRNHLTKEDVVSVFATLDEVERGYELLEPVIVPSQG